MEAETYLRAGQPVEAQASLIEAVRKNPADSGLRKFLCQLQIVNGQWERARNQLEVISQLEPEGSTVLTQLVGALIRCEGVRAEVFAGNRTPLLFGEPEPWMGWLVEACRRQALGEMELALDLHARAFEAAPATPGQLDGQAFEWIADADSRLGPMLEVILDGRYHWVPFCRIRQMELMPPAELRDLVWAPAKFIWANDGEAAGFVPARYPGSETNPDGALRLGRKTEWLEMMPGFHTGVGQRLLTTDLAEAALLEIGTLTFDAEQSSL